MNRLTCTRLALLCLLLPLIRAATTLAQETTAKEVKLPAPRQISLDEAVQLALKHNHVVRISQFKVEEKQHTKDLARSAYFPVLRNDSNLAQLTDTQFIGIPAGSLGFAGGTPIPSSTAILTQGGKTLVTSGTGLTQPLSDLWKIRPANEVAAADLNATRDRAHQTENTVALKVHQLYYLILIAQVHREAAQAKIQASDALQQERFEQVKYGSTLEEEGIESRAQFLEAKQDLLTTDLALSDLTMQLNDAIGLPLKTQLSLDPTLVDLPDICALEDCIKATRKSHPEIVAARAEVEKASAAGRLARADYIPDISGFARYSYQNNVPFLARNFGSFGVQFTYDLFDGGRRRAEARGSDAQLD